MELNTTPMLLALNKLRPALKHPWFALRDENPLLTRLGETDFKRNAFCFAVSLVSGAAAGMNALPFLTQNSQKTSRVAVEAEQSNSRSRL